MTFKQKAPLYLVNDSVDLPQNTGEREIIVSRVAVIERDITHVNSNIDEIKSDIKDIKREARSDFRWLLGTFAAGFLIILSYMWHLSDKMDNVAQAISVIQAPTASSVVTTDKPH